MVGAFSLLDTKRKTKKFADKSKELSLTNSKVVFHVKSTLQKCKNENRSHLLFHLEHQESHDIHKTQRAFG